MENPIKTPKNYTLPSLTAHPSQNPNPPEIVLNSKYFSKHITLSTIIQSHLSTNINDIKPQTTDSTLPESPPFTKRSPLTSSDEEKDIEPINDDKPIQTMVGSLMKDIRQVYKFKDYLGGGHFGTVRIAYRRNDHHHSQRFFAIKSISKQNLTKDKIIELIREVDIISNLDHPNIIRFYETYHDNIYFHIVMELCKGQDLLQRINNYIVHDKCVNEKQIALYVMKVLHAISYCHSRGITHRDLKPENILFESNEHDAGIKLIDFGLSRKYTAHEKMHTILGTPYYVAPEVLEGNYDEKCDIWSIGAITYFMLCGEPPFKGNSSKVIFHKIIHDELKFDTNSKWKYISKSAIDFVKTCLTKNAEQRPNANVVLQHEWFTCVLNRLHSSLYISNDILMNLKQYTPGPKFRKIVLKYFTNMMSHAELKVYRAAFYGIDFKHSGVIERDEVEQAFAMAHVDISNEQIKKIFSSSDDPNKLTLSYSEFIICCMNIKNIINKDKLKSAFNYFDIDNSGVIDFNDVRNAMLRYGKKVVNDDDVYKMIKEVTKKETDLIHFEEFYNVFKHLIE